MVVKHWLVVIAVLVTVISLLAACAPEPAPAPTPAPAPAPAPAPKPAPKPAEKAAAFYKGKTFTFLSGYAPGGGFDLSARLKAPYLEKYTGTTVVVRNIPGASGLRAANYLASVAKPDGLTIAESKLATMMQDQLLQTKGVQYDLTKVNFICSPRAFYNFVAVRSNFPYKSIGEVIASGEPVKFASSSRASETTWVPTILLGDLGMKVEHVVGYAGSAEQRLAVLRGECDAIFKPLTSIGALIKEGQLRPLCLMAPERDPRLPDVPTIYEVGELSSKAKYWLDYHIGSRRYTSAVWTNQGVPKERVQFLRGVFKKLMADKELLKRLNAANVDPTYASAEDVEKYVKTVLAMPPDTLKEWKELMGMK